MNQSADLVAMRKLRKIKGSLSESMDILEKTNFLARASIGKFKKVIEKRHLAVVNKCNTGTCETSLI